jgi:tetratricopeptide (TPR) repeat protein
MLVCCHLAGTFISPYNNLVLIPKDGRRKLGRQHSALGATCPSCRKKLGLADALDSVALLQKARKVAEETISFLSGKPVCAREESIVLDEVQRPVRLDRYLVSFRAHIVCKALGDVDAAIGYLEDAIKYDSENTDNPVEKLKELKAERGTGNKEHISKVVRWES